MNLKIGKKFQTGILVMLLLLTPLVAGAYDIQGITGSTFNLTTGAGNVLTGDGNSLHMWLYGVAGGAVQYPGPTLIVNEGDTVTINLTNNLPVPISLVIPGMEVAASGAGSLPGLLTREVPADNGATTVTYTFTASQPGTYMYYSGSNQALQIEMGLLGAIIVRPAGFNAVTNRIAYGDAESAYDHENLFLMTDIDVRVHDAVVSGNLSNIDFASYHSVYWFLNGRTLPDTLAAANAPYLKYQPYNSIVMLNPGQRVLYRIISAGRTGHPLHTHGNHHLVIAKNSQFLSTAPGVAGADLSRASFTAAVFPGDTLDAIMTWTGEGLGWDVYGHAEDVNNDPVEIFPGPEDLDNNGNGIVDTCAAGVGLEPGEDPAFHCAAFPVTLPNIQDLTVGQFYSGSPFLGAFGALPPGEGGFNAHAGFFFMQHSHNEKELTNNNIFPGGLATFMIVVPPSVPVL